ELDGDRPVIYSEDARLFTRRRTDPPRELGEVVRLEEHLQRVAKAPAIDEVVPLGDEVSERAALMTKGDAAVHAARSLRPQLLLGERAVDLVPVVDAHRGRAARGQLARELLEPGRLTHDRSFTCRRGRDEPGLLPSLDEDALVVVRHDLDEARERRVPF